MALHFSQNLDLAKSILSFAEGECLGMTPEQRMGLRVSALDVLRPLANSTEPRNAEAAFLMSCYLPPVGDDWSEDGLRMSDEATGYLVEAAARGFSEAIESINASGDPAMQKAMGKRTEELAWAGD